MFQWFNKVMNIWRLIQLSSDEIKNKIIDKNISHSLSENINMITSTLGDSKDIIIRQFSGSIMEVESLNFALIYIKGLVDQTRLHRTVLKPIMETTLPQEEDGNRYLNIVKNRILTIGQLDTEQSFNLVIQNILAGNSILLLDNINTAIVLGTKGWEKRQIQDTQTDVTVRGPHEGFTETLIVNMSQIRRILRSPKLTFESHILGKVTNTEIAIAYLKGIAHPSIIKEVKKRLKKISIDYILESGYLEEFISDHPLSLFSTVSFTERPDVACSKLLEGRVAILIEGNPMVLTVPKLFIEAFQHPEEYYRTPLFFSTILRAVTFVGFLISTFLPAGYVAVTTYHIEMLPTPLLVTIQTAMEGTPFPSPVSILIMLFIAEVLNRASLGLPRQIGQAVSIVGALVLGEAAVASGLIGAPEVIVVGISVIASYTASKLNEAMTILRVAFLILATLLGAIGLGIGTLLVITYLASLKSFGVPFLTPVAPLIPSDLNDVFYRGLLTKSSKRKTIQPQQSLKKQKK